VRRLRPLSYAVLALGVAAPALVAQPAAAAAQPCWRDVIEDWTNGGIQHRYAARCYSAALQHLPVDVRLYSNASDDIHRELLAALRRDSRGGGPPTGGQAAAGRTSLGNAGIPLPALALITLTVTLAALALVGLLRMRRGSSDQAPAPPE
jgi:hypothetical protein